MTEQELIALLEIAPKERRIELLQAYIQRFGPLSYVGGKAIRRLLKGESKGNLLDIAYTRCLCPTVEATDIFRRSMAETHRCVLCKLLRTRKIEF